MMVQKSPCPIGLTFYLTNLGLFPRFDTMFPANSTYLKIPNFSQISEEVWVQKSPCPIGLTFYLTNLGLFPRFDTMFPANSTSK